MSLEQAIAANTAALEALTAVLAGAKVSATTTTTTTTEKAPEVERTTKVKKTEKFTAYEARFDKAQMTAALNKVKEDKGVPEAKRIIKEVGKQDKMADIVDPAIIDAVCDECAKVSEASADDDM